MENKAGVAVVDDEKGVLRTYELLFKRRNISLSFTALDSPDLNQCQVLKLIFKACKLITYTECCNCIN